MSRQRFTIRLSDGSQQVFELDVGKRRRLSMAFVEGELRVRAPYGCTKRQINDFIVSNTDWIKENARRQQEHTGLPRTYSQGEKIKLLGEVLQIEYAQSDRYFKPCIQDGKLMVAVMPLSGEQYRREQVDGFISRLAEDTIKERFSLMCQKTGRAPKKLTIKSMTSRWGSYTAGGNIAINYKVICFSLECIDYVCIHELCHLEHMDHSEAFWSEVERYCPRRKEIRKIMNEQ